ncbi:MAG: hypothetical protein AAFQ13_00695 [Pseudomonadota bacterium]
MAAPTTEPLLDLDTLIKRPFILIDDVKFSVLSPDELSVIQSHGFARKGERIRDLHNTKPTGDEKADAKIAAELDALVKATARAALVNIDDETFDKLSGAQQLAIVQVFTALLMRTAISVAGAMHMAAGTTPEIAHPMQIGGALFPGSSGSTAAPRESGWRRFLLYWFGLS